ncbi:MAG: alpha/beta hydrolase [Actinomycetota bacterium]|nr:alpha/beta hydrolase [Actinomycetota bacterium]
MPSADLGDLTLHYKEHGDGPPALGIMGFALDQRYWATQVAGVTATHRFITFDNRGVGRSTGNAATSIDQMADDAVRLLDHLGIDRAVVYGVSMGGAIAQRLVIDHPDRVSALILALTFARPIEFMRRQHALARFILEHGGVRELTDASLIRMFTPAFFEVGQETIDRMVAALFVEGDEGPAGVDVLMAQLDALDKHDVLVDLPRISCPTLVIGARMDVMVPGFASEEIAAAIPGAELVMLETGHGAGVEEMDAFNGAVAAFLARL